MAEADVEIMVANVRLVNSSQVNSSRADSYSMFDIMDGIPISCTVGTDGFQQADKD